MRLLVAALLVTTVFAGCTDDGNQRAATAPDVIHEPTTLSLPGFKGLRLNETPEFSLPVLVDSVRAGGEPVIAILPSGTILISAHPGWTHYHPSEDPAHPGAEILTPANVQSYLWRSTDGGVTWSHVNLAGLPANNVPRSTALGVSDPEFTVMEDGTVCMTDLIALASSSTSCSEDDGVTWLPGNSLASGGPNDRQWLASVGDEFYFTANYFANHRVRASTDKGLTWEDRGNVPCSQDLIGNPHNGHLIVGCGAGIGVSEDGGWTWEVRRADLEARGFPNGGSRMAEPAIDAAGNIWVTWSQGERRLFVGGTPDEGLTWPWIIEVTPHFNLYTQTTDFDTSQFGGVTSYGPETPRNGSYVWPWISAGSQGRIAVTWIGSFSETPSGQHADPWFLFTAYILGADQLSPAVYIAPLTPTPIHFGPICQGGTGCQVTSLQGNDSGDRRLGDFFETTIDAEGFLHATVSDTFTRRDDVISHPVYVRQVGGVRLLAAEDVGVYMPTQG